MARRIVPTAPKLLAYHLGRALQLTNILRDLDEDAARGRLYLPREALEEAGVTNYAPHAVLAQPEARRRLRAGDAARARTLSSNPISS